MRESAEGEDSLLRWVISRHNKKRKPSGVGDDAALIDTGRRIIATTDTLVEGVHFRMRWSGPCKAGFKATVASISDIAAMGGTPTHLLVSVALPSENHASVFRKVMKGVEKAATIYKTGIVGGDISESAVLTINTVALGKPGRNTAYRSNAKKGDVVCVTKGMGESLAGLLALKKGIKDRLQSLIRKHLLPRARVKEGMIIAKYANAMMDLSDGLLIDSQRLARASKAKIEIELEKDVISKRLIHAGKVLGISPAAIALAGGEDYELLFTITKNSLKKLSSKFNDFVVIGEVKGKGKPAVTFRDKKAKSEADALLFRHFS